jgi:hypothetical protein
MTAGRSYSVSVTMYNSGDTTWTSDSYRLASENYSDNTLWTGGSRIYMPTGTTVAPGSSYTFYFTVVAPSTQGYYNFQWRMVNDSRGLRFGEYTPNVSVYVTTGSTCNPSLQEECEWNGGVWNSTYCRCRYVQTCGNAAYPVPCHAMCK